MNNLILSGNLSEDYSCDLWVFLNSSTLIQCLKLFLFRNSSSMCNLHQLQQYIELFLVLMEEEKYFLCSLLQYSFNLKILYQPLSSVSLFWVWLLFFWCLQIFCSGPSALCHLSVSHLPAPPAFSSDGSLSTLWYDSELIIIWVKNALSPEPYFSHLPILISPANPHWPPLSDPAIWNSLTVCLSTSLTFHPFSHLTWKRIFSPWPLSLNFIPSKLVCSFIIPAYTFLKVPCPSKLLHKIRLPHFVEVSSVSRAQGIFLSQAGRPQLNRTILPPVLWGSLHGTATWTILFLMVWIFSFVKLARLIIVAGLFLSHFPDGNCMLEILFLLPRVTHPYDGVTGHHITSYEEEGVQTLLIWSCVFRKEKLIRYWGKEVHFRIDILTLRKWDPIFFLCPSFSNVGGDGSHIPSHLEY